MYLEHRLSAVDPHSRFGHLASIDWEKNNCKTRRETFKFVDLVRFIHMVIVSSSTIMVGGWWEGWVGGGRGDFFISWIQFLNAASDFRFWIMKWFGDKGPSKPSLRFSIHCEVFKIRHFLWNVFWGVAFIFFIILDHDINQMSRNPGTILKYTLCTLIWRKNRKDIYNN